MSNDMTWTKKPLYRGDPNSPFTICYKKLRRHSQRDIHYLKAPRDEKDKPVRLIPFCKHCKQMPYDMDKMNTQENHGHSRPEEGAHQVQ